MRSTELRQQPDKLADRKVGLPDDRSQRPSGDLLMIGDGQWMSRGMAQMDVATLLPSDDVASRPFGAL